MANETTYSEASRVLQAIKVLEDLEAKGTISEAEQKALDAARKKRKTAEQAQLETAATYGGARAGVTMNLYDEMRGAYNAANELLKGGNIEGAKQAYAKYRDLQRQIDEALQVSAPEQYAKGEVGGGITSAVAPAIGATKLMQGVGTLGKMGYGALTGATATALPQFGRGEGGFTERVGEISPVETAIGAGLGAAAPVAGRIAGAGTRAIQDVIRGGQEGFSGGALRRVGKALNRPQVAGVDIEQYLASLGPEGMVADIAGSPRSLAQGLATMQGSGADILRQQIEARAGGAGKRIEDVMTTQIDQPNVGFEEKISQQQQKTSVLGPMYEAATQSDKTFNVDTLRSALVLYGKDASRATRNQMNSLLRDLGEKGEVSAEKLHNVRSALSDVIRKEGGAVAVNMKPFLAKIDDRLDEIEGYASARSGYAESSAIERAVEAGEKVFTGGRMSAISPRQLEAALAQMSDIEREAFKKGARDSIGSLMGTSRNDAPAAWGEFEKSWNAEKLRMLIGDDAAQQVTNRLFAEKEFSGTRSDVLKGSQSAFREEAAGSLADIREPDSMRAASPISRAKSKLFDEPVNAMINEIVYGSRRSNLNKQIGELLTMQGAERDKIVPILLEEARRLDDPTRAQQIIEALTTAGALTYAGTRGE